MKRLHAVMLVVATVLAGGVIYLGVHAAANHYMQKPAVASASACTPTGVTHFVTIQNSKASPSEIMGKLCDSLQIINKDSQVRLMAFGEHEDHQAYDGVLERTLDQNQRLTITLTKTGTYKFHDHLDDSAQGTFTVTK